MLYSIKKAFYKYLSQATYLKVLHLGFLLLYRTGFLKRDYIYKYHYFVRTLIHEGDCVVDIGANLGYFSTIFADLVGAKGKVVAIEPVKPFFETLTWALRRKKNVMIYHHALGTERKWVKMTLPNHDDHLRTGLAHVADASDKANDFSFDVEMVRGSELLSSLPKIDYIKCDIEGYEEFVLPELRPILERHLPTVQIETSGAAKTVVFDLFQSLNYRQFGLYEGKLIENWSGEVQFGDFLFVHQSKVKELNL